MGVCGVWLHSSSSLALPLSPLAALRRSPARRCAAAGARRPAAAFRGCPRRPAVPQACPPCGGLR
eukprot:7754211-Alexandrium_andersonii.AAC.1